MVKSDRMLIIMRGWPGCGKSTMARHIARDHSDSVIYATDDYWMKDESYCFDPELLSVAHAWNQARAREFCSSHNTGWVIIDNCNVKIEHMQPYRDTAEREGYVVVQALPPDVKLVRTLMQSEDESLQDAIQSMLGFHAGRNVHDVSLDVIREMISEWEDSDLPMYTNFT